MKKSEYTVCYCIKIIKKSLVSLSQSRQYMNRHSKTAIKICGAAAVVATAWISAGFMFHDQVMEAANEKERELAAEVHWDTKKNPFESNIPTIKLGLQNKNRKLLTVVRKQQC